ncbi:MAG: zf-TFIIB domain-containing protein [Acidobacteria bacterium]|nr:zf-TFIIB domain-containing protein [Acidobacteriota bacterium]
MPVQPSEREDEYFTRLEIKKRLEEQARLAAAMAENEKQRLRELHYLHCPKCGTKLHQEVMESVTVDICPACHGVWLDDGELTKLTEAKPGVLKSLRRLLG